MNKNLVFVIMIALVIAGLVVVGIAITRNEKTPAATNVARLNVPPLEVCNANAAICVGATSIISPASTSCVVTNPSPSGTLTASSSVFCGSYSIQQN